MGDLSEVVAVSGEALMRCAVCQMGSEGPGHWGSRIAEHFMGGWGLDLQGSGGNASPVLGRAGGADIWSGRGIL